MTDPFIAPEPNAIPAPPEETQPAPEPAPEQPDYAVDPIPEAPKEPKSLKEAAEAVLVWIEAHPYGGRLDSNLVYIHDKLSAHVKDHDYPEAPDYSL